MEIIKKKNLDNIHNKRMTSKIDKKKYFKKNCMTQFIWEKSFFF